MSSGVADWVYDRAEQLLRDKDTGEVKMPVEDLGFADVYMALDLGFRVQRAGWKDIGVYLWYYKTPDSCGSNATPWLNPLVVAGDCPPDFFICGLHPMILMRTPEGYLVPWSCDQQDMNARDWQLVLE
jgi:hypothetical protein